MTASEEGTVLQLITQGNLQLCSLLLTTAVRHRFSTEISIAVITFPFYRLTRSPTLIETWTRGSHTAFQLFTLASVPIYFIFYFSSTSFVWVKFLPSLAGLLTFRKNHEPWKVLQALSKKKKSTMCLYLPASQKAQLFQACRWISMPFMGVALREAQKGTGLCLYFKAAAFSLRHPRIAENILNCAFTLQRHQVGFFFPPLYRERENILCSALWERRWSKAEAVARDAGSNPPSEKVKKKFAIRLRPNSLINF